MHPSATQCTFPVTAEIDLEAGMNYMMQTWNQLHEVVKMLEISCLRVILQWAMRRQKEDDKD